MSTSARSALPEPHPVDPGSALAVLEGDLLDPSLEEILPGLPHPVLGRLAVGEALRAADLLAGLVEVRPGERRVPLRGPSRHRRGSIPAYAPRACLLGLLKMQ